MSMTLEQSIILIASVVLGTMLTRFLPFTIFSGDKLPPLFIQYLGKILPFAVIGLLVIYCLKDIPWANSTYMIPQVVVIVCITLLHLWKKICY